MTDLKTNQNNADVHEFIKTYIDSPQKQKDSSELLNFVQYFTGYEPKMRGNFIIGFGQYYDKSVRSRLEGN
jgi:hypothetical protein